MARPVIRCVGCGLDITGTPKIRRNLGSAYKGDDSEASERVLYLWKELLNRQRHEISCSETDLRMCRSCFNSYDKLAIRICAVNQKLVASLEDLQLAGYTRSCTGTDEELPNKEGRKRKLSPSEYCRPSKRRSKPPVMLSTNSTSPQVMVTINNPSGVKRVPLYTPNRRHITKSAAWGHKKGVADHCFDDPCIKKHTIQKISIAINRELKKLCSKQVKSILQQPSFANFHWVDLITELEEHAPVFLAILKACTRTKHERSNRLGVIGICAAVVLKFRYHRMSLVQKIISTVLHAGHSGKQVYERLQKLSLSLSHKSATRLVTTLGNGHDNAVKDWVNSYIPDLQTQADSILPSHIEQSRSYTVEENEADRLDSESEEDDELSESSSITSGEYSYSSESDDSFDDEDVYVSKMRQTPVVPLIAHPPQVLEPCHHITSLPGLPITMKHKGYRIVGDNIDKNIQRRHLRLDRRNQSVHHFHAYAVENRIDVSEYSDKTTKISEVTDIEYAAASVLPKCIDDIIMKDNIAVLVSRILFKYLDIFNVSFDGLIEWHIEHKHYSEMSSKSTVVPLGILPQNETTSEGMAAILTHLHQYVPYITHTESKVYSNGETEIIEKAKVHSILFGGDQLTAARARHSIKAKINSQTPAKQLVGIIPVMEDWHTKANFLGLIWKYYYSFGSGSQHGTLYQLRNLLGRTNVKSKPINSFDACEDFFVLVIEAHVVAAAMKLLGMQALSDIPSKQYAPKGDLIKTCSDEERKSLLDTITRDIVKSFLCADYNTSHTASSEDMAYQYSSQLLTIGCMYLEFRDAIKEGDGIRVLRCYRYLLPMFISSGRTNYAIETLNFLMQYDYLLSPRQAEELIWGRFINTHGQAGKNISNDLHCEHLNKSVKTSIALLQANKTTKSMQRVARALGTVHPVLHNFDEDNHVADTCTSHKEAKSMQDLKSLLKCLNNASVFTEIPERKHLSFSKPRDPLHVMPHDDILKWVKEHISCYFED